MQITDEMIRYIDESQLELKQLIRDLCRIPTPSGFERNRAEYCKCWLENNGCKGVYIDEVHNVICPYNVSEDNELVVFMAHTDTVFPDTEPMPFMETSDRFYAPGVCDDTANLAVMLICIRYFIQRGMQSRYGLIFAANSGEEGLGNLKGCRAIVERYGKRMRELITFDGVKLNAIVSRAVGSHRYRVTVRTEGGHSFSNFGNRNAIHVLASMIEMLYDVKVPRVGNSQTTYNVGKISGGTSVNTIAQEAQMLYEYRSDNNCCLETMQRMFESIVSAYRATGVEIEVEKIGDRPCAAGVDQERQQALLDNAAECVRDALSIEPSIHSGSTDCNIPLANGIPAICMSACQGSGCHTREEELELSSLPLGCSITMRFIAKYFV